MFFYIWVMVESEVHYPGRVPQRETALVERPKHFAAEMPCRFTASRWRQGGWLQYGLISGGPVVGRNRFLSKKMEFLFLPEGKENWRD